uniref:uncharacterized protein LOC120340115 n=1 Tax=Styela clava TaxID=7725 RepID=UPI001939CB34|nr:uncharacterized protein LOC120340115 [Styela clava]
MEAFKLLFICFGFATTVDITVKVRFRGSAVMTPYQYEETTTAKNEKELREKLADKLENALLDKQIDEVTITTEVFHGHEVHSTQVIKFDITNPNELDGTTFVTTTNSDNITKAVTSSSFQTEKNRDVTTTTVIENVFTTRSITSIASTRSFQESTTVTECGVVYKSKCFQAFVYDKWNVTLSAAESICKNKLANIYDVTHYDMLREYLRPMIPDGRSWIGVRTGMTYKNGQLYATTGQAVSLPTEVWHPNYPSSAASFTTAVVDFARNPKNKYQGIFNVLPSNVYHGAIFDITVKVRFRGSAVMTPYQYEETTTAKNETELREKLTEKLENAILDKHIDEVTIMTKVFHGKEVHSTQVIKFDVTDPNELDGTTFVTTTDGDDITVTSSSFQTEKDREVTTTTVIENVFTT